jgi:glycosidase
MRTTLATLAARLALVAVACVAAACASTVDDMRDRPHQQNAEVDWRDQIIYQIVVDRFANGDPNNDYNVRLSAPGRYHGGDWQGLIDQLSYLEALGVTALWISPVVRNVEEDAGFHSYHGYWTQDFLRTNPHFGDAYKLRELVDAAHARGMLVLLDVVTNHIGQLFYYDINGNGQADEWLSGGGTSHTCVQVCQNPERAHECTPDELIYCENGVDYFERILEWDPEYDPRGIQGWTSGGYNGPAQIRFTYWPESNRTLPPRPPAWMGWPEDKAWFDDPAWYNRRGRVYLWWHERDYSREFVREQEILGDFPGGLKDLDTDHPDVQEAMILAFTYWMDVADFDGFRIDTLKHIDRPEVDPDARGFFGEFTTRVREHAAAIGKHNFFIFGEAFDGNDELLGAYTFPGEDARGTFGRLDSVFYFSQKYRVVDEVFKHGGPTRNIECMFHSRLGTAPGVGAKWCGDHGFPVGPVYYDQPHAASGQGGIGLAPQQTLVSFLDNHDIARFLFDQPSVAALHNALFFLLTWDGIPCLYYGTEQRFAGGTDPANREDMFLGNPAEGLAPFDESGETFGFVKALIALRKEHVALRRGEVSVRWSTDRPRGQTDSGVFAFERVHADQTVLVVLSTADDQDSLTCAPAALGGACMQTSFAPGTALIDVAPDSDGQTFTVEPGGVLRVTVAPRGGRILVAP